jgi:cell division septal protein FtsQ
VIGELYQRADIARRVSQIDVTDPRDAIVILKGDTALVRIGDERFVDRIQSYIDLQPTLRERVPSIDYVDLRFDERVYVRPQGRSPRSQNRAGG